MKLISMFVIGTLVGTILMAEYAQRDLKAFSANRYRDIEASYFIGCREAGKTVAYCKPKTEAYMTVFKEEESNE